MAQKSKEFYRNSLKTVIALRAKAKNISQKEALIQVREEMKIIKQKAKSQQENSTTSL